MKVLAILQNQWFHDPDKVRLTLDRHPEWRRRYIHYALFAGCRTGLILKAGLGEDWCRKIVWEEASPEIGGEASSVFPADYAHILKVIYEVRPNVILALGKIATDAVQTLCPIPHMPVQPTIVTGPHPTARGIDTITWLRGVRVALDTMATANVPLA